MPKATKASNTNPLGPGTKNLTVNVSTSFDGEVLALAEESQISKSDYVRAVLRFALQQKMRFRLELENAQQVVEAAARQSKSPAPITLKRAQS